MSLDAMDLDYLRGLVRKESAIVLDEDHGYLLEARLSPLARAEGLEDLAALSRALRGGGNTGLKRRVVEAMTTNETSFFRDAHSFEVLRTTVLPDLRRTRTNERTLRIWSAACSTGQEACSIGMTLVDHHPDLVGRYDVRILGTDLSLSMVDRARTGLYSAAEVARGLTPPLLSKYFVSAGPSWRVSANLGRLLEFQPLNLAAPWPYLPQFDLVFLRNVLMYFDMDTRRAIFARLRSVIRRDGFLFLGAAESAGATDGAFECVRLGNTQIYRPRG